MSLKTDRFINAVAPIAVNEYLSRNEWILPSVCIAQGALESGWNPNAKSVFGIKGTGFKATTTEYYNGNMVTIEDSFRCYPDLASSVVGYYDFLRDTPRYKKALNNPDYKDTLDKLIHTTDGYPYATDPNYIKKVISIIEIYDLTRFDIRLDEPSNYKEVTQEVVNAVIRGDYGNGSERIERLKADGYNPDEVQEAVNQALNSSKPSEPTYKKVTKAVVNKVIRGDYGNGSERIERLKADGYNPDEVQEAVNQALS